MNTKPTTHQKYIAVATLLPVIVDWIEELRDTNLYRQDLAKKFNLAINAARMADMKLYERTGLVMPVFENGEIVLNKNGNPLTRPATDEEYKKRNSEMSENQIDAQRAFIQWIASEVKDPNELIIHSNDQDKGQEQEGGESDNKGKLSNNSKRTKKNTSRDSKKNINDVNKG